MGSEGILLCLSCCSINQKKSSFRGFGVRPTHAPLIQTAHSPPDVHDSPKANHIHDATAVTTYMFLFFSSGQSSYEISSVTLAFVLAVSTFTNVLKFQEAFAYKFDVAACVTTQLFCLWSLAIKDKNSDTACYSAALAATIMAVKDPREVVLVSLQLPLVCLLCCRLRAAPSIDCSKSIAQLAVFLTLRLIYHAYVYRL